MTTVCSKCAEGAPSAVLMVQPSSSVTDSPDPLGNDRFYSDDQTRMKPSVVPWIVVVGHERLFVDRSADAVPSKLRHHVEALAFNVGLYGSADAVERLVGPCPLEGVIQR